MHLIESGKGFDEWLIEICFICPKADGAVSYSYTTASKHGRVDNNEANSRAQTLSKLRRITVKRNYYFAKLWFYAIF